MQGTLDEHGKLKLYPASQLFPNGCLAVNSSRSYQTGLAILGMLGLRGHLIILYRWEIPCYILKSRFEITQHHIPTICIPGCIELY